MSGTSPEKKRSFAARWGEEIAANGFTLMPNELLVHWHMLGLTRPETFLFERLLFYYRRENDWPCPSQQTLATITKSSRRSVRHLLDRLERKGWLKIISGGPRVPCRYDLSPGRARLMAHAQGVRPGYAPSVRNAEMPVPSAIEVSAPGDMRPEETPIADDMASRDPSDGALQTPLMAPGEPSEGSRMRHEVDSAVEKCSRYPLEGQGVEGGSTTPSSVAETSTRHQEVIHDVETLTRELATLLQAYWVPRVLKQQVEDVREFLAAGFAPDDLREAARTNPKAQTIGFLGKGLPEIRRRRELLAQYLHGGIVGAHICEACGGFLHETSVWYYGEEDDDGRWFHKLHEKWINEFPDETLSQRDLCGFTQGYEDFRHCTACGLVIDESVDGLNGHPTILGSSRYLHHNENCRRAILDQDHIHIQLGTLDNPFRVYKQTQRSN